MRTLIVVLLKLFSGIWGSMNNFLKLYEICKKSETIFLITLLKYFYYKVFFRKDIISHQNVTLKGIDKINLKKRLFLGVRQNDLSLKNDRTLLNIKGELKILGDYSIGRGCRFTIGKNAEVELDEGYININSIVSINYGLKIGKSTFISWNCQILDDDLHEMIYEGKKNKDNKIIIGSHVWIGSNVSIFKGVTIADNSVVAANSVVTRKFSEKNCLIAGNPAVIVKRNIDWK